MASRDDANISLEKEIALKKEIAKITQSNIKLIDIEIKEYEKQITALREQNKLRISAMQSGAADSVERKKWILAQRKALGKLTEAQKEHFKFLKSASDEEIRDMMRRTEAQADMTAALMQSTEAARDLGSAFGQTAGSILGIDNNWRAAGLTGSLINALDKGVNLGQAMSEIGSNIKETMNPMNMFGSLMTKIVAQALDYVNKLSEVAADLRQVLGVGPEITRSVAEVTRNVKKLGISVEDVGQSYEELSTTSARFLQYDQSVQKSVATTATTMKLFGIEARSFATAFDVMTAAQGKTARESEQLINNLRGLAMELKVPPHIIMEDYGRAATTLMAHGGRMEQEFKDLSAAAKATAMSMDSLLNTVAGFDTFAEAGDKVGSLNALLGGAYFDTVQMVTATESERVRLLIQGVAATGKSFNQLGRFERKAIANAAGITDMAEANKLFNTSLSAYDELQALAEGGEMSLRDLSNEAFKNLSWSQKFNALLLQLTPVLDDLVRVISWLADGLKTVVDWLSDNTWAAYLIVIGGIVGIIWKVVRAYKAMAAMKAGIAAISGIQAALAANTSAVAAATAAQGVAAGGAAAPIAAAGTAAGGAAGGMAAFGVAVLEIGAGIGLAAAGIGLLAGGFGLMFSSLQGLDTDKLWDVLKWLSAFTAAATLLGAFLMAGGALVLGAGMAAIGGSLAILALSLALLPEDEINALGFLFSSIGSLTSSAVSNFLTVTDALADLDVPDSAGIIRVTHLVTKVSEIDASAAVATEGILKNTVQLAKLKVDEKNLQFMDKLIHVLTKLSKAFEAGGKGGGGGGGSRTVIMEADGYRMAEVVLPYISGRLMGMIKDVGP